MHSKGRNIKFNINDIDIIFNKLCKFYDIEIVKKWKNKVDIDINELFKKYQIDQYKLNKNSYMGVVIDCNSINLGPLYIKIVPSMTGRFKYETETLKRLSSKLTCKIFEIDIDKTAIIMEKIIPGTLVEFNSNENMIQNLFEDLFEEKICIDDFIDKEFKSFSQVVEHDYNICEKSDGFNEMVSKLYNEFLKTYENIVDSNEQYLLHGDIYKNNLILSDNGPKLIDPLGFKAPFVMELVSICAYEMFYSDNRNKEILNIFVDFFNKYADEKLYKEALFCQLVKVYIPSIYEANDGGIRAQKWLNIISELYSEKIGG